jgi:hydroxymethylbilane synthase
MTLRLATRRSPLAMRQAELVRDALAARGVDATLVEITSSGDRDQSTPLRKLGGHGIFAVEVQRAVLDGRADAAVHSAKDLPSTSAPGLVIACVPERRDPADALVGRSLAGLGPGATVATGSPRRRALLLARRPDLRVVELRGNMATRLAAVGHDGVDAVVAAVAALDRLDVLDRVSERLDPTWFTPQVGQGALAVECRSDDHETLTTLAGLSDATATRSLEAERSFLRALGAGCSVPAGAHATVDGPTISLTGVLCAPDGERVARATVRGVDPLALGPALATSLLDEHGARDFWSQRS